MIMIVLSGVRDARLVQLMLDGMDTSSINQGLISAATSGHVEVARILLAKSDSSSVSIALEVAARENHLDVLNYDETDVIL